MTIDTYIVEGVHIYIYALYSPNDHKKTATDEITNSKMGKKGH